jgi:hypothetical protein
MYEGRFHLTFLEWIRDTESAGRQSRVQVDE